MISFGGPVGESAEKTFELGLKLLRRFQIASIRFLHSQGLGALGLREATLIPLYGVFFRYPC
jgi:hypothetical protein